MGNLKRVGRPQVLTDMQRAFVAEYLKDFNAKEAAVRAGYSPRNARALGSRLMSKPQVRAELDKYREQVQARAWLTVEKVLADLEEIRQRAVDAGDYRAATKAAELLGRYLSMWTERVEHTVEHRGGIQMTLCSAERARRILRESLAHDDDVIDHDDDAD